MLTLLNTVLAADLGTRFLSPWGKTKSLGDLLGVMISAGISIGGIIVLFTFLFGGFKVIQGAGSGDAKAAAQGQQAVTYALFGFIIVFISYWIIRAIEVVTGSTFITNPLIGAPSTCTGGPC